jgi:hypothetical protein
MLHWLIVKTSSMDVLKISHWSIFDTVGVVFCAIAIAILSPVEWEQLRAPVTLGLIVSLPWAVLAVFARATDGDFYRCAIILGPLGLGLLFARTGETESWAAFVKIAAYVSTMYGLGWPCARLLIAILLVRKRKE